MANALVGSLVALAGLLCAVQAHYPDHDLCPARCICIDTVVNCANVDFQVLPRDLPIWTELLLINDNPLLVFSGQPTDQLIVSPNNLTQIDLTRTQLQLVESNVFSNIFNDIRFIERTLQVLIFDENDLTTFPLINNVTHLRTLSLASNKLDYDAIFGVDIELYYSSLERLDLSNNQIKHIPHHFLGDKQHKLTSLILHNNGIETIDNDAFEMFTNLKVLKLSKNKIVAISKDWLRGVSSLRELDLNFNQIDQINILAFEELRSLQTLKMRRNKLETLNDGAFWGLSKLQKLHLDHNSLSEISLGWTYGLSSLRELSLKHNSISKIQDRSWSSTLNLIELQLSHNKLQEISRETFDKLVSLRELKLSNNQISFIDEHAFRAVKSLESLDLSYNRLSWAIESSNGFFIALNSLSKLRLDHNQIRLIFKHTFNGLSNLSSLNLTANPISSIQSDSFAWFRNLKELVLEETDLLCDCTMRWLLDWLRESDVRRQFGSKMRCKHPPELYQRTSNTLLDAQASEFKCQDFLKPYMMDDFGNVSKPIAAIKNKNATFYCKVATSSVDEIQFQWLKDNQIVNHERAKFSKVASVYSENVTQYTSVFTLNNVQDEDRGRYHCVASNNFGSVHSHKFPVNVYVVPYFQKKPYNITVKVGNTARLECTAKGQPSPTISWYKDGGDSFPAATERRMHMMPTDDVFFIVEVKKSDMGTYTCNATNEAGSIISTAYLNVIEPPSFVRKMVDKKAALGSTVSLECMAAGIPMPQITWFKDGNILEPTQRHFFTAEGQLLIIVKLKESDEGEYFCNISNTYGTVHDSSYLQVLKFFDPDKHSNEISWQSKTYKKPDTLINQFQFVMHAYGWQIITIILVVVLTSIVWILVICHIRQRHKSRYVKSEIDDPECGMPDFRDDQSTTFEPDQYTKQYYPTSDFESETSSARDTGIEGSCKSNEDESDHPPYSIDPQTYLYRSLPRQIQLANFGPFPLETSAPQTTLPMSHLSLPRKQTHRSLHFEELFASNGTLDRNQKASVLSSKEKKRIVKQMRHQQITSMRKHCQLVEVPAQLVTKSGHAMHTFSMSDIT